MNYMHWNYFLALEKDVERLSRYVELNQDNMSTYSIEIARILMSATQEIDVMLKLICHKDNNNSDHAEEYRHYISKKYPKFVDLEIQIPRFGYKSIPFLSWKRDKMPEWWLANNKLKHERHDFYNRANLENALNAVCALFMVNIYYYTHPSSKNVIIQPTQLISCDDVIACVSPSNFGYTVKYKLPE